MKMPALLNRTSSLPNSATVKRDGAAPVLVAGHVEVDIAGARPTRKLVGEGGALLVEEVTDDHLRALGHQHPRAGAADVARAAADQRDFAVYTSHAGR